MKPFPAMWAAAAWCTALAAFLGQGWWVVFYPVLLTRALRGRPLRQQMLGAAAWGVLFAGAFYAWAGAYGLPAWLALSLVRGLPWALYPLPAWLLGQRAAPTGSLTWQEIVGGGLGLGLVSALLLGGPTGVDWETPAGALCRWPELLAVLPWLGLVGVATLLGWLSHAVGSAQRGGAAIGLLGLSGWLLGAPWGSLDPSPNTALPLKVALLQTGWSQEEKWDAALRERAVERLLQSTEQAALAGAQLVIWPETAWPFRGMRRRVTNTRRIGKTARRCQVDLLASSIEEVQPQGEWWNSASLVLASGRFSEHYVKRRLAPFAEYLPLPSSWQEGARRLPLFSRISRFVAGDREVIFQTSEGHRFGVLICYESMTPALAQSLADRVDFLVVLTNDAPFQHQPANEAHFRSAILRAIACGKPVLQAANTGVTGVVSAQGRVLTRSQPGYSGADVQFWPP